MLLQKRVFSILVIFMSSILICFSISFEGITVLIQNNFEIIVAGIFAVLYLVLLFKEVSIVENGYEKKYSFTSFVFILALMTLSISETNITMVFSTIVYVLIEIIRIRKLLLENLLKSIYPVMAILITSQLFGVLGGVQFPLVNFPKNFFIIFLISIINYLIKTLFIILHSRYFDLNKKKSIFKMFFQEYGWIYKYDLWQAIYAILFFNSAAVFLYGNLDLKPQQDAAEQILRETLGLDPSMSDILMQEEAKKIPSDFLYFISWQIIMGVLLLIPLNGWLSSFKTFIFYNKRNVKNVIQKMSEGIIVLNNKLIVENINDSAKRVFNIEGIEDIGRDFSEILDKCSASIWEGEQKIEYLLSVLKKGDTLEKYEIKKNEDELKFYEIMVTPEVNRFNEVTGTVITIEDVTNFRKIIKELQETQEQLIITEKMAVIGQLVSGVAHEMNTPVASIKANNDLIKMFLDASDASTTVDSLKDSVFQVQEISNSALERIMELVQGMKNFARLDEAELKAVNAHEGIDSTLGLIRHQFNEGIEVIKEYGKIPLVTCYAQQLNQVFMNVLLNAFQSISGNGSVIIKTFWDDENIYIRIKDTGEGIPPENLPRIFDPGFTTKGVGVGTGLGLSISYKIIEKHKGKISAKSEISVGTEIELQIPINI